MLRLKNQDFSRDAGVVAALNADPLMAHESQPTRTLAALVRADQTLKKSFERIELPVLILHGAEDKAAKLSGSQRFDANVGAADKTLRLYEGSFHNPLNDFDQEAVIRDIPHWAAAHLTRLG